LTIVQVRACTFVSLTEPVNQNINRTMDELAALGIVHPYLLADGTIELRPSAAIGVGRRAQPPSEVAPAATVIELDERGTPSP